MMATLKAEGLSLLPTGGVDGSRHGVLFAHGSGDKSTFCLDRGYGLPALTHRIVDAGHAGFSGDNAGPTTWGNQASIDAFNVGVAKLEAAGAAPGKVAIVAASMGAAVAFNWAARNPSKVACLVAIIPVVNLTDIVSNNRMGWAPMVSAAYGSWSEAARGPAFNPATQAANGLLAGIPMLLFYGTADAGCVPAQTMAFASNVGPSAQLVPMPFTHEVAAYNAVDHDMVVDFITSHTEVA